MKNVVKYLIIAIIFLIILFFFLSKRDAPEKQDLEGIYTSHNGRFYDTLILYRDHSSYHSSFDNDSKQHDFKSGTWAVAVPNYIIIQDFSFSLANHPVDAKYYYNLFGEICIDIGLSEKYCRSGKVSH
jgi:hypothetical protein